MKWYASLLFHSMFVPVVIIVPWIILLKTLLLVHRILPCQNTTWCIKCHLGEWGKRNTDHYNNFINKNMSAIMSHLNATQKNELRKKLKGRLPNA